MFSVLIKIIPLDLAATLSPGILALVLVLLGSRAYPMGRTLALLSGNVFSGLIITLLGFYLGQSAIFNAKPTFYSSLIDLTFGLVFLIFGLRTLLSREHNHRIHEDTSKKQLFKWFIVGFLISITNFDAAFLSFTAAKEVGMTDLNIITKTILLIMNIGFFILPITLPLFIYLCLPKIAARLLNKLNVFVFKYSKYIVGLLFMIFGLYFLFHALKYLF